jgi:hypothetical protein
VRNRATLHSPRIPHDGDLSERAARVHRQRSAPRMHGCKPCALAD